MQKQTIRTFGLGMHTSLALPCLVLILWKATPAPAAGAANEENTPVQTRVVAKQALPQLDGNHLALEFLEVTYKPGQSSKPHRHPCAVIGYVLEGAVRMQVKDQAETVYRTGESFYESPNEIHLVSANASTTQPAKFLACFLYDHETPLSVPVSATETTKIE